MRGGLVFWGLITFSFPQAVMAEITRIADLQRNQLDTRRRNQACHAGL
ncbi:hypothetical protein [Roseobacter sp. HKCCD7870]